MPVARMNAAMLEALVQSLLEQFYERWELHLVGDPPADGAKPTA